MWLGTSFPMPAVCPYSDLTPLLPFGGRFCKWVHLVCSPCVFGTGVGQGCDSGCWLSIGTENWVEVDWGWGEVDAEVGAEVDDEVGVGVDAEVGAEVACQGAVLF